MRVTGLFGWVAHNNARSAVFLMAFALLTQPMAMIVLFVPLVYLDPAHAPWYAWAGYGLRYAPLVALAALGTFVLQMRRHLGAVREELPFRLVDKASEPRLVGLVEPLAISLGLGAVRVGVLETFAMNAFACGVSRNASVVVFTRGLVDGLDDDELAAVIAHELIHVRNRDTRLIAAANVFMHAMTSLERANLVKPRRYRQIALILLAPILFPVYLGVALLTQLCVRLGHASRLLISASREFIADAEAVRLTQHPAALVSALQCLEGDSAIPRLPAALDAMMIAGAAHGLLATHPRIAERIAAIVATTGAMALDARPRRDTRSDFQKTQSAPRGGSGDAPWTPNEARKLARIAATAAAPRQSSLGAFWRVGEDGELGVFGLRWDMAAAMLATFCAAMIMHHGDLAGFMSRMGHALDRPDVHTQALVTKAIACRNAELGQLMGGKAVGDACEVTPDWTAHAAAKGIHLLGDGRLLNDSQLAILSPDEIKEGTETPFDPAPMLHKRKKIPMTDLAPSYSLPLHEAWLRLVGGDLQRYLRTQQCGLLIHAHISSEPDRSVSWSITSEGEERVRFTATLEPISAQETRVILAIYDRQPRVHRHYSYENKQDEQGHLHSGETDDDVVVRPALATPLRPAFAGAVSAMLEQRLFDSSKVWFLDDNATEASSDDTTRDEFCTVQRGQLETSSMRFSFHDQVTSPW